MAETKKFLDFAGLTRYNENLNSKIDTRTGSLSNLNTTSKTNLVAAINEANSVAKGANIAWAVNNYSDLVTALSSAGKNDYKVGQNIYIRTVDVPDVWISSVNNTQSTYTYVSDAKVIEDLNSGTFIVGYYQLSELEGQKVDLSGYATTEDIATINGNIDDIEEDITDLENNKLNKENEIVIANSVEDLKTALQDCIEVSSRALIDLNEKTTGLEEKTNNIFNVINVNSSLQTLFANDEIYQKKDNLYYPLSHPDLSTQPSILPERFGNLEIYEVLVTPDRLYEIPNSSRLLEAWGMSENGGCVPLTIEFINNNWVITSSLTNESLEFIKIKYINPTNDSYYYGYGGGRF